MSDEVRIYRDSAKQWRWQRKAGNGEIIADSGESYTRVSDALRAAERVHDGLDVLYTVPGKGE